MDLPVVYILYTLNSRNERSVYVLECPDILMIEELLSLLTACEAVSWNLLRSDKK